jgi:hypothetical protein
MEGMTTTPKGDSTMKSVLCALVFFVLAGASSAHAQLPPGPVLVNGGVCMPSDDPTTPCTITVIAPDNPDLQCIFFTNVRLIQILDLPVSVDNPTGDDCLPALPNQVLQVRMSRPNPLGTGHILYVAAGSLAVGLTRASTQGILVDISLTRFKRLAVCPLQQIVGPIEGCPATGNDISPGEPLP